MPLRLCLLALALVVGACRSAHEARGVGEGRVVQAQVRTHDGARIVLWRWTPRELPAPRLLVVPELGFDHTLVAPLCERLRNEGFDVWTLDGRHLVDRSASQGWTAWNVDVARAAKAMGEGGALLALGVGGEAAFAVAQAQQVRGVVAVNAPLVHEVGNAALESALRTDGFDPARWLGGPLGDVLLGAGHQTSRDVERTLARTAHRLPDELRRDVALLFAQHAPVSVGQAPLHVFASFKDNLVVPEDALFAPAVNPVSRRRLGMIELFARDYGHLDWLAAGDGLDDVVPVLADALERLP